ncbi:hypothetical protein M0R45_031237 [Rubus argutus]|uniref:Uncharacterized protein n=1 Tax=Rubus argutus TaxID=59490 RepID=A0AAW1WCZ5_RUBAR
MVATEVPQVPSKRNSLVGDLINRFISGRSAVSVVQLSRSVPSPACSPPSPRVRGSYRYGVCNHSEITGKCKGRAPLKSRCNCRGSGVTVELVG